MDVISISRLTDNGKDLEILLLRQQLRIVERKQERGPQIPRWHKVPLVALSLRMTWELEAQPLPMRYLIHDHDTKFTGLFDTVFEAAGIEIVDIPFAAPNANSIAERWVRSVREECLDRLIILNEHHLRRGLTEYITYYNTRRPHQGIDQDSPLGLESGVRVGAIPYRNVLGGLIRDYYREAA